ncbi:putative gaba permease protein [Botrytis fragariae]|uniref:Putative gaba permease protein n=1 Tax=Botrytis fragariae TaxID=1964551 RepID=A0A8H6AHN0_9HELO|nr:putative gaba permease protein [Botrytis fragariae]KAF5867535.1 putative gaba permease protein [Botrytis fragariae]
MEDKHVELGVMARSTSSDEIPHARSKGNTSRDDQEMAYFGKRQQLKRNFGFLSIAGFVCSLLSTWEGMFAVFLYGFQNGGPAGLVYGYVFCFFGTLCTVASLAEMSSMMPLSGGQYHWVSILAPKSHAKFLSYMTGWLTVIGWQAGQASVAFLCATLIQALVILNHPTYVPERWQATLIFYAVLAFILFVNTYLARWLPKIEGFVLCVHILGFFGILIPLVYLAPHGKPSDVFATFINGGGWSSNGTSFFIGLITSVFSFLGADSACHMSEEVHNASTVIPWAMISSIVLNGVLGFALLIALLFCLGDIDDALNSATGFPFIEIFRGATNSNAAATGMTLIILFILLAAAIGIMATASRLLWSFARDNGVPGSSYISRVHEPTALPIYSILVSAVISLLLALINIGSTAAFNSIVSVNVAAFFTSYMIPIILILKKRLRKDPIKDKIHWGPWKLGPILGPIANIAGLIYSTITMFFSFWPNTQVVTPVTMNWSCVIFVAAILYSVVFYMIWGKHAYKWPIVDPIRRRQ